MRQDSGMLILLPPSEGKTAPVRGKALDLGTLVLPELTAPRTAVLDALTGLCSDGTDDEVRTVLGLTVGQAAEIDRNRRLRSAPTAAAATIYTGVLYGQLGLPEMSGPDLRRANAWVRISSGLWGCVSPADRIPAYRLSGTVALPGVGRLQTFWRQAMDEIQPPRGPIVDMRSGTYAAMWRIPSTRHRDTAEVRVFSEKVVGGQPVRSIVSHMNKFTKGQIARRLITSGHTPRTIAEVVDILRSGGFRIEVSREASTCLDVIITS